MFLKIGHGHFLQHLLRRTEQHNHYRTHSPLTNTFHHSTSSITCFDILNTVFSGTTKRLQEGLKTTTHLFQHSAVTLKMADKAETRSNS